MSWNEEYGLNKRPTFEEIDHYINNSLWEEINEFIKSNYLVEAELGYSSCCAKPGWNVKYKKSGKSLCTLYPMEDFFTALIVIGNKEVVETEMMLPIFTKYIQKLYKEVPYSVGGKWLMIDVTNPDILQDIKNLIKIRVPIRKK